MTQILLKRSSTGGNVPATLGVGELAINIVDGLLFWLDGTSTVQSTPLKSVMTLTATNTQIAAAVAAIHAIYDPEITANASAITATNGMLVTKVDVATLMGLTEAQKLLGQANIGARGQSRQTILAGPVDANGLPTFMPAIVAADVLLNFVGANNATTVTDSGNGDNAPHAIAVGGNAKISTAQAKFGTSSLYVGGTQTAATANTNGIIVTSSPDTLIGTSDFTISKFIFITANTTGPNCLFSNCLAADGSTSGSFIIGLGYSAVNCINISRGDAQTLNDTTHPLLLNTWNHVSICRVAGVFYVGLNGTIIATFADATNFSLNRNFGVGRNPWASLCGDFFGYLASFHYVVGQGLYSGALGALYTPPAAPIVPSDATFTLQNLSATTPLVASMADGDDNAGGMKDHVVILSAAPAAAAAPAFPVGSTVFWYMTVDGLLHPSQYPPNYRWGTNKNTNSEWQTTSSVNRSGYTTADLGQPLEVGATVLSLGTRQPTNGSVTLKIIRRTAPGVSDVVVSQAYAYTGNGLYQDCVLTTPFVIPNDGYSYYAAIYQAYTTAQYFASTSGSAGGYNNGNPGVSTGVAFSEDAYTPVIRVTYAPASTALGAFTLDLSVMQPYLGDGSNANKVPAAFFGESVLGAKRWKSHVGYAIGGVYDSQWNRGIPASSATIKNHNIGTPDIDVELECKVLWPGDGYGFAVGDVFDSVRFATGAAYDYGPQKPFIYGRNTVQWWNPTGWSCSLKTQTGAITMNAGFYAFRLRARRRWGLAR